MKERKAQGRKPEGEKVAKSPPAPAPSRQAQRSHVWLNVQPDDLWFSVPQGETIWEALERTAVELGGECGGLGKCGKCRITVLSGIDPPTKEGKEFLSAKELKQGLRLACRTKLEHDMVISTGRAEADYLQILTTSHILSTHHLPLLCLEPLIHKRLLTVPTEARKRELSDLERVRAAIGPKHSRLGASLHCLYTLPWMLRKTDFSGVGVIHEECLMEWQDGKEEGRSYGLAFDLGTSTVVGKLINLVDGTEVAVASCLNSQSKHGSNVISRLQYVRDHTDGLVRLHHLIMGDLNSITMRLLKTAGLKQRDIFIAVAAGNTTMQHIALSLNPSGIAEAPFSPVLNDGLVVNAAEVGLKLHPDALLYVMPTRSGYIGGDLISVVLASGVAEQVDEIVLGLDLGTNGEIFLGNRKRLMTCSAAAGPALEGARVSHGMIAKAGAIESVSLDEDGLRYGVIGSVAPIGVCGSGLVELVAALTQCDVIDGEGLIHPPRAKSALGLGSRVVGRSGVYDFLIASAEESGDGKPHYLTQRDVRELQLAKGAIAAGVHTLMNEMGIGVGDIDRVYLAGALGNYVSPSSAMRIGLIPRFNPDIVSSLGNAASMGASMVLLSKGYWTMANELSRSIEHVELSSRSDFNRYFVEQMDFPAWD